MTLHIFQCWDIDVNWENIYWKTLYKTFPRSHFINAEQNKSEQSATKASGISSLVLHLLHDVYFLDKKDKYQKLLLSLYDYIFSFKKAKHSKTSVRFNLFNALFLAIL